MCVVPPSGCLSPASAGSRDASAGRSHRSAAVLAPLSALHAWEDPARSASIW